MNDLGNPSRQEVPDDEPAVVAADGQQGAVAVELAANGHRDAVQRPIVLLGVVLPEGL